MKNIIFSIVIILFGCVTQASGDVLVNDVPFLSQRSASCIPNNLCGYASTAMLTAYYHDTIPQTSLMQEMANQVKGSYCPIELSNNLDLQKAAREVGKTPNAYCSNPRNLNLTSDEDCEIHGWTWDDLKGHLNEGLPVAVTLMYGTLGSYRCSSWNSGHSVVVVGYSESRSEWLIHDPLCPDASSGAYKAIPSTIFRQAVYDAIKKTDDVIYPDLVYGLIIPHNPTKCIDGYGAAANTPSTIEDFTVSLGIKNNCTVHETIEDVAVSFHDKKDTGSCIQKCYRQESGYELAPGDSVITGTQPCNMLAPGADPDPCNPDATFGPGEYLLKYKVKYDGDGDGVGEWHDVQEKTVEILNSSSFNCIDGYGAAANTPSTIEDFKVSLGIKNSCTVHETIEDVAIDFHDQDTGSCIQKCYQGSGYELAPGDSVITGTQSCNMLAPGADPDPCNPDATFGPGEYLLVYKVKYGGEWYHVRERTVEILNSSSFSWNLFLSAILAGTSDDETISTVTSPATGRVWMDRNLGASRVATSMTDTEAYGGLYQWGRLTDGHEKRNSPTTTTLSPTDVPGHGNFIVNTSEPYDWRTSPNNNLWQGESGINNPCPSGFRLPTESELQAEVDSWSTKDGASAFGSVLKFPAAGYRQFEGGSLVHEGAIGSYWTSSIIDDFGIPILFFSYGNAYMSSFGRVLGGSVRCIKGVPSECSTISPPITNESGFDMNIEATVAPDSENCEEQRVEILTYSANSLKTYSPEFVVGSDIIFTTENSGPDTPFFRVNGIGSENASLTLKVTEGITEFVITNGP